jgi:hypothetical protein
VGKGLSRWDWIECAGILCRCLGIACTICYMIYYAAFLFLTLVFCSLLSCVISWALCVFYGGSLFSSVRGGRVLVFRLSSALVMLLVYMFWS